MKFWVVLISILSSFSLQAATSLSMPVLLEQSGKIKEVRDFKELLTKSSIVLPETIEVNFLRSSEEILPEILKSLDHLSFKAGSKVSLVTDASVGTFTDSKLKQKLCFRGEPVMALRLLPHFADSFFSYNTIWIAYRLKGQLQFLDFDSDAAVDIARLLDKTQSTQLRQPAQADLQIITKVSAGDPGVRVDAISRCP